jgi:hypothetical protein
VMRGFGSIQQTRWGLLKEMYTLLGDKQSGGIKRGVEGNGGVRLVAPPPHHAIVGAHGKIITQLIRSGTHETAARMKHARNSGASTIQACI